MGLRAWVICVVGMTLVLTAGIEVRAKQPVFVSWLLADDPGDQTILDYWQRYEAGKLSPQQMVDLGTMLFYRGYPKDAVRMFKAALHQDKHLAEAWFRIGLVEHQQGDLRDARGAYNKSLKLFKGNGWCQFYYGLLEEQEGNAKAAMKHFEKAFRYAPVLADENVNPEMVSSDLALGAWLKTSHQNAFGRDLPMPYLDPDGVKKTRASLATGEKQPLQPATPVPEAAANEAVPDKKKETAADTGEEKPQKPKRVKAEKSKARAKAKTPGSQSNTKPKTGGGAASRTPKPQPTPGAEHFEDTPYGLPGNRNVSADAFPGF